MAPVWAVLASGFLLLQAASFRVIMLVLPTWQHGFDSPEYSADARRIHAVFLRSQHGFFSMGWAVREARNSLPVPEYRSVNPHGSAHPFDSGSGFDTAYFGESPCPHLLRAPSVRLHLNTLNLKLLPPLGCIRYLLPWTPCAPLVAEPPLSSALPGSTC